MFKTRDKVRLKLAEELEYSHWKAQELGVGIITSLDEDSNWCEVQWENDEVYGYRYRGPNIDLIKVEGETSKMPTKEQVFETAQKCPEAKATLEILFPEYFNASKRKEMVPFTQGTYFKNKWGVIAQLICIDIYTWCFINVAEGNRWTFPLYASYGNHCPNVTFEQFYHWIKQDSYNWTPIEVDIVERTK